MIVGSTISPSHTILGLLRSITAKLWNNLTAGSEWKGDAPEAVGGFASCRWINAKAHTGHTQGNCILLPQIELNCALNEWCSELAKIPLKYISNSYRFNSAWNLQTEVKRLLFKIRLSFKWFPWKIFKIQFKFFNVLLNTIRINCLPPPPLLLNLNWARFIHYLKKYIRNAQQVLGDLLTANKDQVFPLRSLYFTGENSAQTISKNMIQFQVEESTAWKQNKTDEWLGVTGRGGFSEAVTFV